MEGNANHVFQVSHVLVLRDLKTHVDRREQILGN
jgi:hypothetical protein